MAKEALKLRLRDTQGGVCPLSEGFLPPIPALIDTDRRRPKASGGVYTDENTRIVDPIAHMVRHGNLRTREEALAELKTIFDDRVQTMKLLLKINNQLLAYQRRTDDRNEETEGWLATQLVPVQARLDAIDKALTVAIKRYDDPLAAAALKVKGLGPITVAALTAYVDFEKTICSACLQTPEVCVAQTPAEKAKHGCSHGPVNPRLAAAHVSSLWRYVGLDKPSHERFEKGTKGGGNKTLRTVLWNTANVMVKLGEGGYRDVYDRVKARLAQSENVVRTRNTKGLLVEAAWKDTKPCHRHGAALRAVIKMLLADYWLVGRRLRGLPTDSPYAQGMLGHAHFEAPESHGWPAS